MKTIKQIINSHPVNQPVKVQAWVKTFRNDRFISVNDGSTIQNLQLVIDPEKFDENIRKKINTGTAIYAEGKLVESLGKRQKVEVIVNELSILGESDPEKFPIQPKRHSLEFLREKAHLRPRTTLFGAIMRVRNTLAFAVHKYFQNNGFYT